MSERGEGSLRNLEQARRECQDKERWKLFCRGHPLVGGNIRGRPPVKWRDRVQEYVRERGEGSLSRQGGSVKIKRDGSSSAVAIP